MFEQQSLQQFRLFCCDLQHFVCIYNSPFKLIRPRNSEIETMGLTLTAYLFFQWKKWLTEVKKATLPKMPVE